MLKILLFIVSIGVIGGPLTEYYQALLLALVVVALVFAEKKMFVHRKRVMVITLASAACFFTINLIRPKGFIDAGYQFFIPNVGHSYNNWLPEVVINQMNRQFESLYPVNKRCDGTQYGCWLSKEIPSTQFAFSPEGIWNGARYSKRFENTSIKNSMEIRMGAINGSDPELNYYEDKSDLVRSKIPYYLMLDFTEGSKGSTICWSSNAYFESQSGIVEDVTTIFNKKCETIDDHDMGRKLWLFDVERTAQSEIQIDITPSQTVKRWLNILVFIRCFYFISFSILIFQRKNMLQISAFLLPVFATAKFYLDSLKFPSVVQVESGGTDALTYAGYALHMTHALIQGAFLEFLRGAESVYYYMPGSRYFKSLDYIVFGESTSEYLFFVVLMPVLIFLAMNRVFKIHYIASFLVALLTIVMPVREILNGFNFYLSDAKFLFDSGAAEGIGLVVSWLGLILLFTNSESRRVSYHYNLGVFSLFMSCFIRPNQLIGIVFLVIATLLSKNVWSRARLVQMAFSFSPLSFFVVHNYFFSHQLVFTTTAASVPANLIIHPAEYFSLITMELRLTPLDQALVSKIVEHLRILFPNNFHVLNFLMLFIPFFMKRDDYYFQRIMLSITSLLLLLPFLFYLNSFRHQAFAWQTVIFINISTCIVLGTSLYNKLYEIILFKWRSNYMNS